MISMINNKFIGTETSTIDTKGRFLVPKNILELIDFDTNKMFITRICNNDEYPHINLITTKVLENLTSVVCLIKGSSVIDYIALQARNSSLDVRELDSSNRLALNEDNRAILDDTKDIYIVGQGDFMNIYSKRIYQKLVDTQIYDPIL